MGEATMGGVHTALPITLAQSERLPNTNKQL
jgi:hypothetical protein